MATWDERLKQIEEGTDWAALIEQALDDPPRPDNLLHSFNQWGWAFEAAHGRVATRTDYPPEVDRFLERLAFARIPPDLLNWVRSFELAHGRKPKMEELPPDMLALYPKGKRGRPRCDTQRMVRAARAWEAAVYRGSYEIRREMIAIGREAGFASCFGFGLQIMESSRPSTLALAKLAEETGKDEDYLLDFIYPRKK